MRTRVHACGSPDKRHSLHKGVQTCELLVFFVQVVSMNGVWGSGE